MISENVLVAIAMIYLVVAAGLGIPALVSYWQNRYKDTDARFRAARQFVLSPIWPITGIYLTVTVISSAVRDGIECLNTDRGLSRFEREVCSWCGESYAGEPCAVFPGINGARRRLKNLERERRMKILEDLGYGDV